MGMDILIENSIKIVVSTVNAEKLTKSMRRLKPMS